MQQIEIIGWMLAVLAVLKTTSALLEKVANKTENTLDNRLVKILGQAAQLGSAFIDLITANTKKKT